MSTYITDLSGERKPRKPPRRVGVKWELIEGQLPVLRLG